MIASSKARHRLRFDADVILGMHTSPIPRKHEEKFAESRGRSTITLLQPWHASLRGDATQDATERRRRPKAAADDQAEHNRSYEKGS